MFLVSLAFLLFRVSRIGVLGFMLVEFALILLLNIVFGFQDVTPWFRVLRTWLYSS